MKQRLGLIVVLAVVGVGFGLRSGFAEDAGTEEPHEAAQPVAAEPAGSGDDKDHDGKPDAPAAGSGEDKDHDGKPDVAAPATATGDSDGDGVPDAKEDTDGDGVADSLEDSDGDGIPDVKEDRDGDGVPDVLDDSDGDGVPDSEDMPGDVDGDGILDSEEEFDEDDPPTDPFDSDGDGVVEPDEVETRTEFLAAFKDIPNEPDLGAINARSDALELVPSLSVEKFREYVRLAKKVVLQKMMTKIAKKSDQKMRTFSLIVSGVSLLGILLLLMPLVLGKKYPGQGKVLFKYSALAALTFIVTVNLFGGVLYGLRTVQGALSNYTNPSIAIAAGTFDTLDTNAEQYAIMGKELFAPTLEQMRKHPEEQPAAVILENGQKIVKDAKVFISIKKMIKKVDFLFGMIPIILTFVTLLLFVLAIKPTLVEIVKMPAAAAQGTGGVGKDVVRKSLSRVKGELFATICTIGVLVVLTLLSSFVLGRIVEPAMDALLVYFAKAVSYLQFVEGASSGLVFVALFGVILFLVLNLATLILSMGFFLGKCQKIFQQKFNEGVPISTHLHFLKWGALSVLLVQVFPLLFAFVVGKLLNFINDKLTAGTTHADDLPWGKILLMGPLMLIVVFSVMFWAVRGLKAIKFLAGYKVKLKAPASVVADGGVRS